MARRGGQNVDIAIRAHDDASPTIRKVGAEFKRMPESFSKAAGAMRLVEGASGGMGGAFAEAANKASGLLSIVTSGGPLGVGIAAVTVAVAAGTAAWKMYKQDIDQAKEATAAIDVVLEKNREKVLKFGEEVKKAAEALRTMGWTEGQKFAEQAEQAERGIASTVESHNKLLAEQADLQRVVANFRKEYSSREIEDAKTRLAAMQETIRIDAANVATTKAKMSALKEMAAIQDELAFAKQDEEAFARAEAEATATATKQQAERVKRAAERQKQYAAEWRDAAKRAAEQIAEDQQDEIKRQEYLIDIESERNRIADGRASIHQDLAKKEQEYLESQRDANERIAEEASQLAAPYVAVAGAISSEMMGAVYAVADGTKTMGEAAVGALESLGKRAIDSVINIAIQSAIEGLAARVISAAAGGAVEASVNIAAANAAITAASAAGQASAIAGFAGIPVIGPGLGLAQAAVVTGMIEATRARLVGAAVGLAEGGMVHTGPSGGLAVLHDKERVLTDRQTAAFERMVKVAERGGSAGSSMTVVLNSVVPATSAEATRSIRALSKRQRALARRGIG